MTALRLIVVPVALHSIALGASLMLAPARTLRLAGWPADGSAFFPSQSGLFLLILGGAYLAALHGRPFAWFLVAAKACAVVFLSAHALAGTAPAGLLLASAALDGLMGAGVAAALLTEPRSRRTGTEGLPHGLPRRFPAP